MAASGVILSFLVSLIISTVIIYFIAKLFGETEGIGTAFIAALIGSVIYTIAYVYIGNGMVGSLLGGIAWLIALGLMYKIGWLKSLAIAVVVWVVAGLVGLVLPTVTGPL